MRIIGYTFDADTHCTTCAIKRFQVPARALFALPVTMELDSFGISIHQEDGEGNLIHPIFSTDEQLEPLFCGTCHEPID